jgi:hypothetical protein
MIRTAAYVLFVVGFAAFASYGLRGWSREPDPAEAPPVETESAPADPHALRTGVLYGKALGHYGSMGSPWSGLRDEMLAAKTDLPPDPAPLSAEDAEKANRRLLLGMRVRMPVGRIAWRDFYPVLEERIEAGGVQVTTGVGRTAVLDSYPLELPDQEWSGIEIFGHVMEITNKTIVYTVTSEGVVIGTDEACNRGTRDAALIERRRRVAAQNAADKRLDAEFRPDVQDATVVAFLRGIQAQTGVEVAMETAAWDMGPALTWHAPPMKLRAALDELCRGFRWYWRVYNGRVWLLKP